MKNITGIIIAAFLFLAVFSQTGNALSTDIKAKESFSFQTFAEISKKVLPSVVSVEVKKTLGGQSAFRKRGEMDEEQKKRFFERFGRNQQPDEFFPFFLPFFGDEKQEEIEIPAAGSGVIIRSDGYIITNNHVIAGAQEGNISIRLNDDAIINGDNVEVVGTDDFTDLAVLKVKTDKTLPAMEFADSDALEIGEWVLAIGNPLELKGSVSQGIISAKHRVIGKAILEDLIQTTASINPGNSGGPLVNLENKIVGLNTAIASNTGRWQGVGFAIPSNTAKNVCESIIESGKAKRGWLGIHMGDLTPDIKSYFDLQEVEGIIVIKVIEGSPAEKAGVKAYDIITAVDGEKIRNRLEMLQKIAPKAVGKDVEITLQREDIKDIKERKIKVNLGERPSEEELVPSGKPMEEKKSRDFESLGIIFREKDDTESKEGLEVEEIQKDSPAAKARITPGDTILEVNREKVNSLEDFRAALKKAEGDRDHFIMHQRGNEILFSTVKQK
ncbi:trypsin-like peptidase domain-containing protein [Candidatus Sumerlaeota bacterium]|nr:trypsin-like peptidase domain-containing protein [Candidatus Sumerlaeota bacterium]